MTRVFGQGFDMYLEKDEYVTVGKKKYHILNQSDGEMIFVDKNGPYPRILFKSHNPSCVHEGLCDFRDYLEEKEGMQIDCIVPYDCHGGCDFTNCSNNIGTMGV